TPRTQYSAAGQFGGVTPDITSTFTITIPPSYPFFNPLPQQAKPTPTPTASEVTISSPALLDLASVFRFNERIATLATNKEKPFNKPLSPILQNVEKKLLQIVPFNKLIDTSVRAIIKEEVKTQLPQIIPQESQNLQLIFLWTRLRNANHILELIIKRELYDALVKSYNTNKDLFETYAEIFTLKMNRDDKDKDQDPSAGLDRGMKRWKSIKDVKSSRDPKSKESKVLFGY
nr:hypothetical protein [Tanacetum cinerariifolium]